jgi:hypothetical protein
VIERHLDDLLRLSQALLRDAGPQAEAADQPS